MTMQSINIELPPNILLTLNETEQELKRRIKTALAMHLYVNQKVTIGKASQIAELSRLEFETVLSENGIPISNLDLEDILGDVEKLK